LIVSVAKHHWPYAQQAGDSHFASREIAKLAAMVDSTGAPRCRVDTDEHGGHYGALAKRYRRKIRCLNYEFDMPTHFPSSSIAFHHMSAFNDATVHRDKLIAQVMRHLAEQIKTQTHNQHEMVTQSKPTSVPNNVVRLPRPSYRAMDERRAIKVLLHPVDQG
jgi:hypothetical protein